MVGVSLRVVPELRAANQRLIFRTLVGASLLLPGGFFLGGVVFYAGDPGLAVVLTPIGAGLLLLAVYLIARLTATVPAVDSAKGGAPARSKRDVQRSA
jgi:predicted phage tail protein